MSEHEFARRMRAIYRDFRAACAAAEAAMKASLTELYAGCGWDERRIQQQVARLFEEGGEFDCGRDG